MSTEPKGPKLVVHRKTMKLMTIVSTRGRIYWCSYQDAKGKVVTNPFWAHHLNFDTAVVREVAEQLGITKDGK